MDNQNILELIAKIKSRLTKTAKVFSRIIVKVWTGESIVQAVTKRFTEITAAPTLKQQLDILVNRVTNIPVNVPLLDFEFVANTTTTILAFIGAVVWEAWTNKNWEDQNERNWEEYL